jgi:uncharacterized DUF497 family protein
VTSGEGRRGESVAARQGISNAHKHDVTFHQAAAVLLDALALTVYGKPL